MNFILYWRIFVLLVLVLIYVTDVIQLDMFLSNHAIVEEEFKKNST
ncbi:hypothetical protein ACM26V_03560 [Salipaludibacillus sp. HK11]